MTTPAPRIRALVLDLDGVLWRGQQLLPGVAELFRLIDERGVRCCLASNNATLTRDEVQARLAPVGVQIPPEALVTSAHAAAGYVRRHFREPPQALVIGEESLRQAMVDAGCTLTDRAESAGVVIVGMDRGLTWPKLVEAGLAISAGAAFIAPTLTGPSRPSAASGPATARFWRPSRRPPAARRSSSENRNRTCSSKR
jgi:4-nitrophenyl phosphatase